ncbi:hypothetical protein EVB78_088 [Rhizobium phage RHph_N1_15]|nr:hypothetical protein EVB78_088 [Rhizobium phage RHph_N1_15]QIG75150.1 hypothetical protein EVC15_088 [Rhizobium phage RHph_N2_6]
MKQTVEDLIAYLRKMFGLEESVDTILKPITKITNKLEKHERAKLCAARRKKQAASRARAAAEAADAAADRAAAKRAKIQETFA